MTKNKFNIFPLLFLSMASIVIVEAYECPRLGANDTAYVKFFWYSRNISDRIELFENNTELLTINNFDTSAPVKILIHGFAENSVTKSNFTMPITAAFKQFTESNIIMVDYTAISGRSYIDALFIPSCVYNYIGPLIGRFLNFLNKQGVKAEQFHIIGHSLGGQISGICTNYMNFKPQRISGLDPAGPYFDIAPARLALSKDDAVVVDTYHTSTGLGGRGPNGLIDFYYNGGNNQIGCEKSDGWGSQASNTQSCSHNRAFQVYIHSINPENKFPSVKCKTVNEANNNKCTGEATGFSGYYLQDTEPGIYYTSTSQYNFPNLGYSSFPIGLF